MRESSANEKNSRRQQSSGCTSRNFVIDALKNKHQLAHVEAHSHQFPT